MVDRDARLGGGFRRVGGAPITALALPKAASISAADIVRELETATGRPDAALWSAARCADQIAPAVIAVVNLAADGIYLLPKQGNLLFWGIHAVAAGRRTDLYQPLVRWLRRASEDELDRLLGDADTETLAGILLSVFDGDATSVIDTCLDPAVDGMTRWTMLNVLARLTFDGIIARDTTIDLLTRFEREQLAEPRDHAWHGWQQAVVLLGIEELRERMHATWEDGRNPERKVDRDDHDLTLSKARALAPGDASLFEQDYIVAIDDPVAALHWVKPQGDVELDSDPSNLFALRADERDWLTGYFDHKYRPPSGVLELLDGYFCGLIAAPGTARCADYLVTFWQDSPLSAACGVHRFDSSEHEEYVNALLTRHWNAIAHDLDRGHHYAPLLQKTAEGLEGAGWAIGFVFAITLRLADWKPFLKDELIAAFYFALASLAGRTEFLRRKLSARERSDTVDTLPLALQSTYDRTHGRVDPLARPPLPLSKAGIKIGRNEPCPCGSGKKHKRCCGSPEKLARA